MNILIVSDCDDKYGAPMSQKQMVKELINIENISVSVILKKGSRLKADYEKLGINVYEIHYQAFYQGYPTSKIRFVIKYVLRGVQYWSGRFFAIGEVRRKIDMNMVDIIHANSSREDLGELLALKYNKPLVLHIREFGDKDYRCYSYRKNYIELMNITATRFVAISDSVKQHWVKKGLNEDKFTTIYNGIEDRKKEKKVRFVIAGSICETKGQESIIEALNNIKNKEKLNAIEVDIIGDGSNSYKNKLIEKIKRYGLIENVYFRGYQKDIISILNHYDCGLMCSKCEGFGRVTIEYMLAGIPVIASNTGANFELVNEKVGFLFEQNDSLDLMNKMLWMLEHPDERKVMGENAQKYARENFNSQINAVNISGLYKDIMCMNNQSL